MNLRDLGWKCGKYPTGERNDITDVPGVSVGHHTIIKGEGKLIPGQGPIRTGVTIVKPHEGIIYNQKAPAGVFVANGYGKSTGIPQILELGWIETPIAITNTFNVGLVYDALISYSIKTNPNIGITLSSCCPIVTECNDSYLNDIQGRHVKQSHVLDVLKNLNPKKPVEQGCVGAGTGMRVFGLKSGVGTASRQLKINLGKYNGTYHIGVLSVPNFGNFQDFTFYGHEMKEILDKKKYIKKKRKDAKKQEKEGGSIIVIIGTDIPFSHRQLNRLARRGAMGITRTGSIMGHSSGDFIFTFSTANKIDIFSSETIRDEISFMDSSLLISDVYRMTIDAVQESIYNAMINAKTTEGRDNHVNIALDPEDLPNIKNKV